MLPDIPAVPEDSNHGGTNAVSPGDLAHEHALREELEVRRTAQGFVAHHLRPDPTAHKTAETFWNEIEEIDLSGAQLVDIDLEECSLPYIRLANAKLSGRADFSGTTFTGGADLINSKFDAVRVFSGSTFTNAANFWADFRATVEFEKVDFLGPASFAGAAFEERATFHSATFHEEANFLGSSFRREAQFTDTTFANTAEFVQVEFGGAALFQRAAFTGIANFVSAKFDGVAWYERTTFAKQLQFEEVFFGAEVNFSSAVFGGDVRFDRAEFDDRVYFGGADFTENGAHVWPPDYALAPPDAEPETPVVDLSSEEGRARFEQELENS